MAVYLVNALIGRSDIAWVLEREIVTLGEVRHRIKPGAGVWLLHTDVAEDVVADRMARHLPTRDKLTIHPVRHVDDELLRANWEWIEPRLN